MRVLILIVAAVLVGCGAAQAQSLMSSTGTGVTSPLGMLGLDISSRVNSGTGIQLGATEINPGGLSPAPVSNCNTSGSSYSGMTGSSGSGIASTSVAGSVFDGGGLGSACASINGTTSGTASPLSTAGTGSSFALNGGAIPLDSTEIDSAGVSPLTTEPAVERDLKRAEKGGHQRKTTSRLN
jgi:hypothetical protein